MSSEEMSWWKRPQVYASVTLRAFPLEAALAFMAASTLSWLKLEGLEPSVEALQWLLWLALSFVACFGLTLLRRIGAIRQPERLWLSVACLAFLAAVIWLLVDLGHQTTPWRLMMVAGALGCSLPLTLLLARDPDDPKLSLWRMTLTTLARSAIVSLFTGAVLVATGVAAVAIVELFDLDLSEPLSHLAIWMCVACAPLVVIRQVTRDLTHHCPVDDVPDQKLGFLARFLLLPTLLTYLAIIFAYTAKVVLSGEAPRNILSPLVLGAALMGVGILFVYEPMARRQPDSGVSKWVRALPWLLLGALPLAGWAICERIVQHGWTEFRYARLLLVSGLAIVFGWAIYQRRYKETVALYTAPAVFSVMLALASFGPWSISAVSEASQQARILDELEASGVAGAPGISRTDLEEAHIDKETRSSIRSRLNYLSKHHGEEAADELFEPKEARFFF